MKWYATFGQNHKHPETGEYLKDYWVEIYTPDIRNVRGVMSTFPAMLKMCNKYGKEWGDIYTPSEFDKSYFPKGKLETLGIPTEQDIADEIIEKIYEQRRNNREIERIRGEQYELLSEE